MGFLRSDIITRFFRFLLFNGKRDEPRQYLGKSAYTLNPTLGKAFLGEPQLQHGV